MEAQKAAIRAAEASDDGPLERLTRKQAMALAGEMFRGWAAEERRTRFAVEHDAEAGGFQPATPKHSTAAEWAEVLRYWNGLADAQDIDAVPAVETLERILGLVANRVLAANGYGRLDAPSRKLLLECCWRAFGDAAAGEHAAISQHDQSPNSRANAYPPMERWAIRFELACPLYGRPRHTLCRPQCARRVSAFA